MTKDDMGYVGWYKITRDRKTQKGGAWDGPIRGRAWHGVTDGMGCGE